MSLDRQSLLKKVAELERFDERYGDIVEQEGKANAQEAVGSDIDTLHKEIFAIIGAHAREVDILIAELCVGSQQDQKTAQCLHVLAHGYEP